MRILLPVMVHHKIQLYCAMQWTIQRGCQIHAIMNNLVYNSMNVAVHSGLLSTLNSHLHSRLFLLFEALHFFSLLDYQVEQRFQAPCTLCTHSCVKACEHTLVKCSHTQTPSIFIVS